MYEVFKQSRTILEKRLNRWTKVSLQTVSVNERARLIQASKRAAEIYKFAADAEYPSERLTDLFVDSNDLNRRANDLGNDRVFIRRVQLRVYLGRKMFSVILL